MFTKQYFKDELKSIFTTAFSLFIVDATVQLTQIYNGDWNRMLLWQIGLVAIRSLLKALLTFLLPQLFPVRLSKPVIVPVEELPPVMP